MSDPGTSKRLGDWLPQGFVPGDSAIDDDTILESFLEWVADSGLELYAHQEEAILEIMGGRHVILNTPTGSGKSLVAVAMHFRALCRGERCYYTSPIKALVSEKFFDLCRAFGPDAVGMLTGDASVNHGASIVCCTAEVLANVAMVEGAFAEVDYVIMDEFHFYADPQRGMAWQLPLLTLPQSTFMLMSATLGDTRTFEERIPEFTGRELAVVRSRERPVPLAFEYCTTPLHETIEDLVSGGRAPVYVVNFTQREAASLAQDLTSMKLLDKDERKAIATALHGFRFDSPYGKDIQRFLKAGVGLHHAGLLPKYRRLVERLAQGGLLRVICGTDTLGVGVNVPIRTVLFTKLCKYDGESTKILSVRDFNQIAGRAGRKGFDDQGFVAAQAPAHVIENSRLEAKARSQGKKKFTRKKAPERGYVPWDDKTFEKLIEGEPETLVSSFRVDHNIMLNLLQRQHRRSRKGGGYRDLVELVDQSYERVGRSTRLRREAAQLFRALRHAGIVELVEREGARGRDVVVSDQLQDDFSLFHTLSLYLVDALYQLDPGAEDHALDVVSLCEAVLEDPRALLVQQERRIKSDLVAEMKAAGVEYEERMERLEKTTHLKPRADFIYDTFNAFSAKHPWVGRENIRPKSITRDMYERQFSFAEYVKEYDLARMEGLLLRHLHQTYKTLDQSVPETYKSDEVIEAAAWIRAMIEHVDSSLVQEWEALLNPPEDIGEIAVVIRGGGERSAREELATDRRSFHARIRAELHQLVRALAHRDFARAATWVRDEPDQEGDRWTPARLEAAMEEFFGEHAELVVDQRARAADLTLIEAAPELDPKGRAFRVRHTLVDPQETRIWFVEGIIDLREQGGGSDNAEGVLLTLERIGS